MVERKPVMWLALIHKCSAKANGVRLVFLLPFIAEDFVEVLSPDIGQVNKSQKREERKVYLSLRDMNVDILV